MKKMLSVFIILSLVVVLTACGGGSSSTDSSSSDSDTATEESSDSGDSANDTYTVGSTFTAGDIAVTLNSVTTSTGNEYSTPTEGDVYLIANWTVTNNGSEEFNPFEFSVSAYVDGTSVESAITSLPDQFDMGTMIIPNTSSTGNKIYEVPQAWSQLQLRVQVGTIDGESAIFEVTPDQVS